jgi:hypothetical protein
MLASYFVKKTCVGQKVEIRYIDKEKQKKNVILHAKFLIFRILFLNNMRYIQRVYCTL